MKDGLPAVLEKAAGYSPGFDLEQNISSFLFVGRVNIPYINGMDLLRKMRNDRLVDIRILLRAIAQENEPLFWIIFQYTGDPGELTLVIVLSCLKQLVKPFQLVQQIDPLGEFIDPGKLQDIFIQVPFTA